MSNMGTVDLVIEGGAMRVAYALGVLEVVQASELSDRVGEIYTSSAGTIAALGFVGADLRPFADALLPKLSGTRFINPRRVGKVVDVDYLVEVVLSSIDIKKAFAADQAGVTVSMVHARSGLAEYARLTASNAAQLLRATMAIPVLYGRTVRVNGQQYVDGGVVDPVPVAQAVAHGNGGAIGIVLTKMMDEASASNSARERLMIRLDPRVSGPVRRLLLTKKPLRAQAQQWIKAGALRDRRLVTVVPSDPRQIVSRTCTDEAALEQFRELGRADGKGFCAALGAAAHA